MQSKWIFCNVVSVVLLICVCCAMTACSHGYYGTPTAGSATIEVPHGQERQIE